MKGWKSCIGCGGSGKVKLSTGEILPCEFSPEKHKHNIKIAEERKLNPDEFEKNIVTHFIYKRPRKPKDHNYEPRHEFGFSVD